MLNLYRAVGALVICGLLIAPATQAAEASDTSSQASPAGFVVKDIKLEGLQRISDGTLLSYLPINVGDRLTEARVQSAIRALYKSQFFQTVALLRDGNTLIVRVHERPSVRSFTLSGNKDIKSGPLKESLRGLGIAEGRIFNQSALDEVKSELVRQYHSRGKYAVKVETDVKHVGNNQVDVEVKIKEGSKAKIREINIVGNHAFSDTTLLDKFKLKEHHFWSWVDDDDAYSKDKFDGDVETLKSYYMNRGYADFQVKSTDVSISPNLSDIYITISVHEGKVYKVGDVKLVGNLKIPEDELRKFVFVRKGATYAQSAVTASSDWMKRRLGDYGYGFAEVKAVPEIHQDTNTADVVFNIDPGRRVYINRVHFKDKDGSTNDEVFRREMRQYEGTWYSSTLLELSKARIKRLPYVEDVDSDTAKVPGHPDLVDVNYDIKERNAGQFLFSIGYASQLGPLVNVGVTHSNFLGSGKRVSMNLTRTTYSSNYSLSETDPYFTINGVSRTITGYYSSSSSLARNTSSLDTTQWGGEYQLSFPLSEFSGFRIGVEPRHTELLTSQYSSDELINFVRNNGAVFATPIGYGTKFNSYLVNFGYFRDTRNRSIFATRGSLNSVNLKVTGPGSDVDYYKLIYNHISYLPIYKNISLGFNGEIDYGKAFGSTNRYPPFENFYAGGPDSVRAFRENYLGPLDSRGYPFGGALRTYLQTELLFPAPEGSPARFSLFFDVGNVYATANDFDPSKLRASAGVGVVWVTAIGALRFSVGKPIRSFPGDQTETLQFTIGSVF